MNERDVYKPIRFFLLTYAFTWIPWGVAAYCSYRKGMQAYYAAFFFLGGFGPFASALVMTWVSRSEALKRDYRDRLMNLRRFRLPYVPIMLLILPCIFFVSVSISERFGAAANQLTLVSNWATWLPLMFLAPLLEELGWRGYGMDALRGKLGMLSATLAFASFWALWHLPLFFINHTYQHDVWLMGPIYVINFFVGIAPVAVLFNWLYYRNNRLIWVTVLTHFSADAMPEILNIGQFSKLIATAILLVVAALIVGGDWKLFGQGPKIFFVETPLES